MLARVLRGQSPFAALLMVPRTRTNDQFFIQVKTRVELLGRSTEYGMKMEIYFYIIAQNFSSECPRMRYLGLHI